MTPGSVKALRAFLGLTQTGLAQRLGVSFTTVNRWENGHCSPSHLAVQEMSRAQFDAELAELDAGAEARDRMENA